MQEICKIHAEYMQDTCGINVSAVVRGYMKDTCEILPTQTQFLAEGGDMVDQLADAHGETRAP